MISVTRNNMSFHLHNLGGALEQKFPQTFFCEYITGMKVGVSILAVVFSSLVCSCVSHQVVNETRQTRDLVQQDIEDQIVLNLIRGKNGLPFVHYDIVNIQSVAGSKIVPAVGGGR